MKHIIPLVWLAVGAWLTGCVPADSDAAAESTGRPSPVASVPSVEVGGATQSGSSAPPPPGGLASPALAATPPGLADGKALVRDVEERTQQAELSEQLYLAWNQALAEFQQRRGRPPQSLEELARHDVKLAELRLPAGLELALEPTGSEVIVRHRRVR